VYLSYDEFSHSSLVLDSSSENQSTRKGTLNWRRRRISISALLNVVGKPIGTIDQLRYQWDSIVIIHSQ